MELLGWRRGINGGYWIPRRGKIPNPPFGYETSPRNPYHIFRILFPCEKRKIEIVINPTCGCKKEVWTCNNGNTNREMCEQCQAMVWEQKFGSSEKVPA